LLKDELPKLFTLEAEFIRPLFQSFYYMLSSLSDLSFFSSSFFSEALWRSKSSFL
jgi:hypothetical protein